MSSLHSTQTTFDPLSAAEDHTDAAPSAADAYDTATSSAAGGGGGGGSAPSEYDSFMTARSTMSYMTASHAGGTASTMAAAAAATTPQHDAAPAPVASASAAAVPPAASTSPPSSLFRRLPDRPVGQSSAPSPPPPATDRGPLGGGGGGAAESYSPQPPRLPQPLPPAALDDNNPFGAIPSPSSYNPPQHSHAPVAGPLSFGDGDDAQATSATFAVPLDLYDTPETFARPVAAAAAAPPLSAAKPSPAAAPLPPLYEFAREFSRVLPVSEDPASPVDAAAASGTGWYDNGLMNSGAAVAASSVGGGAGAQTASVSSGSAVLHAGGGWTAAAGGGLTSYAAAALLTNTVSVHSPRKMVVPSRIPGLSEPYILYEVTSRSAVSPETTVERRFRDVVALAELLQALYPGCFVPPRPSRNAVEGRRMQPAFIEERRAGIEKFLRRLVVHPVLGPSEATQVWLHAASPELRTCQEWLRLQPSEPPGLAKSTAKLLFQVVGRERRVPSPVEVTRPAAAAEDMYRVVHERASQFRGVMKKVQPSPMEAKLREEATGLQERSDALHALSRKADALVDRSVKISKVDADLGTALAAEAEAEMAAVGAAPEVVGPTPAAALRVAVEGLAKVSKLYGVATDASAKHLTPLHDWLAAVPGAVAALAARERCLLTLATLEADDTEAKSRLAEAEARAGGAAAAAASPPTSVMKKVDALRLTVSQLDVALTAARDEYERVGSRNMSELSAFKAHMSRELADAVREYALVQLAAAQKAHDIWVDTANQLATLAAAAAAALTTASGSSGGIGRSPSGVAIGVGLVGGSSGGSSSTAHMYGGAYGTYNN